MELRYAEDEIHLEGNNSKNIVETLRYMKKNGWFNIGKIKMIGSKKAIFTMKEDYYDEDIIEILEKMNKVFMCGVSAKW